MKLLDAAIGALTKCFGEGKARIGPWAQESRNVSTIMTHLLTGRQ